MSQICVLSFPIDTLPGTRYLNMNCAISKDNKAGAMPFQTVKGTHDILPEEVGQWRYVEELVRRMMAVYNYQEIRTPVFEHTELFSRSIGQDTDIVGKEMYTFTDEGKRSLTLSPEGTAPVVRAYIQNNLGAKLPLVTLF